VVPADQTTFVRLLYRRGTTGLCRRTVAQNQQVLGRKAIYDGLPPADKAAVDVILERNRPLVRTAQEPRLPISGGG
jgi:hypothetical protein